jgi:hypothetical protein
LAVVGGWLEVGQHNQRETVLGQNLKQRHLPIRATQMLESGRACSVHEPAQAHVIAGEWRWRLRRLHLPQRFGVHHARATL